MSYPNQVQVHLLEINGLSCGSLNQNMQFVDGVSPPRYAKIAGGNLRNVGLFQAVVSGNTTWKMTILNINPGSCYGNHALRRAVDADDPTGMFYVEDANGDPDSSLGQARNDEI